MCVFLLFGLLSASALDLNTPTDTSYGIFDVSSHLRLVSNLTAQADHSKERVYEATLINCYDGDTCSFDVKLPSAGAYSVNGPWDYGLGFIVERPASPSTWTLPLVQRKNQHVRLCDINAPELHPGNPPAAVKARDDLIKWIRASKKVHLHVPQNAHGDMVEKYGRLLVYVYADDVNLNEKQLKQGNAVRFIQCK